MVGGHVRFFLAASPLAHAHDATQLFIKNENENLGEIAIIVKTYIQVFMIAGMVILIRTFFKNDFLFFVDVSDLCTS